MSSHPDFDPSAVGESRASRDALAHAFISGFVAGSERPQDAGDSDAMGQAYRDWRAQCERLLAEPGLQSEGQDR